MIRLMRSLITLAILGSVVALPLRADDTPLPTPPPQPAAPRLSPNPSLIIVEPFYTDEAAFLVKLSGWDLETYKMELSTSFQDVLVERLQKLGPTRKSWTNDTLPRSGWLVRGEFVRVYAGSGILRNTFGFGAGKSTFTCRVYVYDLSVSDTNYVLTFDTGVASNQVAPGFLPAGGVSGAIASGAAAGTGTSLMVGGIGAGAAVFYAEGSTRPFPNPTQANEIPETNGNQFTNQYQDMARTARTIRDALSKFSETGQAPVRVSTRY